jgi:hypothetical protein
MREAGDVRIEMGLHAEASMSKLQVTQGEAKLHETGVTIYP